MRDQQISTDELYELWSILDTVGKIEVIGRMIQQKINRMSRGRKIFVLATAALALTIFVAFAAAILGVMSAALRIALWALILGLLVGAVTVWIMTR